MYLHFKLYNIKCTFILCCATWNVPSFCVAGGYMVKNENSQKPLSGLNPITTWNVPSF